MASTACSTVPWAVSMITGGGSAPSRIRASTSMPSTPGMRMSLMTDHVGLPLQQVQARGAVGRGQHLVPGLVQNEPHDLAEAVVVVDHEDASHRHS